MSILVKRMQQGGGLYADPKTMDLGARSLMVLLGNQGGRGSVYPQVRPAKYTNNNKKNSTTDIKEGLPSDINFYNLKKQEIDSRIQELMLDGINNDEKAEYEQLLRGKYELENSLRPQIKTRYSLYKTTKSHYDKEKSGDLPAISGGMAFVIDKDEIQNLRPNMSMQEILEEGKKVYKIVDEMELLRNADKYNVLTASDLLDLKTNNVIFSGFTSLGQSAEKFLNNLYGDESFLTHLNKQLSHSGYTKHKGFMVDDNGRKISPDAITEKNKNNLEQIKDLYNNILHNITSNSYNYIKARAVYDTYLSSIRGGGVKTTNKSDDEIKSILDKNISKTLLRSIKQAVVKDMELDDGNGSSTGRGGSSSGKDKKYNVMALALGNMGNNEDKISMPIDAKGDKALALAYSTKSSYVDNGGLIIEKGYNMYEDNTTEESTKRLLKNNQVVRNIKGSKGVISTVDGKNIYELVGNEDYVTTPSNTDMHIILAPIEKRDGKDYVNFNNKYAQEIALAVDKVYEEWNKQGIDARNIVGDPELHKKAENIANNVLKEELGNKGIKPPKNLRIGLAVAFDVLYMAEGNVKDYKYQWDASPVQDEATMDGLGINTWLPDTYKKTKVFVPVSRSFFTNIKSYNYFDEDYLRTYHSEAAESALTTTPTISNEVNPNSISKTRAYEEYAKNYDGAIMEKNGGKLATANELMDLIF